MQMITMLMNMKLLQNHVGFDFDYVVNSIWHFGGNYRYQHQQHYHHHHG